MNSDLHASPGQPHGAFTVKSQLPGCCIYFRLPFFLAVEEGDATEVLKFLREDALWLKVSEKKGKRTAWHIAAAKGHVQVLQALVARTREDDVRLIWNLSTPLSSRVRAVATGRDAPGPDERVFALVNCRTTLGPTPLTLAAEHDHPEAIKYLISVGADPWMGDNEGRNPAHYAARTGAIRALQVLLEEEKPLTSRASNRNLPGTRYVDSLDTFGFSPLHYATWANRKSAMMLLIGFDANIIARSLIVHDEFSNLPPGSSPLHIASFLGDLERVKLLLRAYYETAADLLPSQTAMLGTTERRRRARSHPDPRLILTRTQRLPYRIAERAGHRNLLDWLDPSVPLMFLFGGEDDVPGTSGEQGGIVTLIGVSRLTVIAAKALHQALLTSLDVAADDIRRYEEEAEARRRRREERRLAREAKAAAQSLKQGKEPSPADSGIRGRIRRLIQRASRDGSGGVGDGAAVATADGGGRTLSGATAGTTSDAVPKTGWRPWRSRTRKGRRKLALSGQGDGVMAAAAAAAAAGLDRNQSNGAVPRSPRRRRRRSTLGTAGRVASAASLGGTAPTAADADGATAASAVNGDRDDGAAGNSELEQMQSTQGGSSGVLNSSQRHRLFRSSGSQRSQQQQQQQQQQHAQAQASQQPLSSPGLNASGTAADAQAGPETTVAGTAVGGSGTPESLRHGSTDGGGGGGAGGGGAGGGGGFAASLTRTMQRLYRGSLRRQSSGSTSSDPAQAQLNERLNRAGIIIPEGPDVAVAYFTPGREPRYNMPTQILLPAGGAFNAGQRSSGTAIGPASPTPAYPATRTVEDDRSFPSGAAAPAVAASDRGLDPGSPTASQSTSTLITKLLNGRQGSDGMSSGGVSNNGGGDGVSAYLAGQARVSCGRAASVSDDGAAASISAAPAAATSLATATEAIMSPRSMETNSNLDFQLQPAVSRHGVVDLPPIRSAGTSRMPSFRTSIHLPGAASITAESESGSPVPSALLPPPSLPPAGRPSSNGVTASSTTDPSQMLEVVAVIPNPAEVNTTAGDGDGGNAGTTAIAATEGGDDAINTTSGRSLSSGIGRVGAGALQLFNSLRETLRGASSRQLVEVLPIARRSPAQSTSRAHRRNRRIRTPDSSIRGGRMAEPSQAVAVVAEDLGTAVGASAGGGRGTGPPAGIDQVRPNTSQHRGSVHSHPHGSLAARGVRVASGWPHARLSLHGRVSGVTHPDAAALGPNSNGFNANGAGAVTRRRMPFRQSPAPSGEGGEHQGQGTTTPEAGVGNAACDVAAAPAVAAAAAAPSPVDSVPAMVPGAAALSSSFSSTSSMESAGGTHAVTAIEDDNEDVCPVCLDEGPNLLVQSCRHHLCMECARDLVKRHSLTPALCPYCRGVICGFKARVAAGQAAEKRS